MKIKDVKAQAIDFLKPQTDHLAIEVLLCAALNLTKESLFLKEDQPADSASVEKFWQMLEKFKAGQPVAQLLGVKEFYGLEFQVNGQVLIPRPETELVVDLARDFIKKNFGKNEKVRVLDVGTGSGCIILSLAKVEQSVQGVGLEISEEALAVSRLNSLKLALTDRVIFRQSDLLSALSGLSLKEGIDGLGKNSDNIPVAFDIILANLPYIGTERFNFVAKDVADFEPSVALYGGPDGLDLYRKLFEQLLQFSWRPALMIGEFGFGQEEEMRKVLSAYFQDKFEIIPDLSGIPRVFVINFGRPEKIN